MEKSINFVRRLLPTLLPLVIFTLQLSAQPVLGNSPTQAVTLIQRVVEIFAWIMLIGGIFAIGRGVYLGWRGGGGALTSIAWGMGGIGFGFLVSWINAEIGGNAIALPQP